MSWDSTCSVSTIPSARTPTSRIRARSRCRAWNSERASWKISRLTSVGVLRVCERVMVAKSANRTLMEIVLPENPARRIRAPTRSDRRNSSAMISSGSSTSRAKVSSAPTLRSRSWVLTTRSSRPQASSAR